MCGVFGYVSHDGSDKSGPDPRLLARVAAATERRGPHAFGFAWIDRTGRLKSFKQTGRVSQHLGLLAMARDAVMLVGHCRYATSGDPGNNLNNHPHPADGGWVVHNGVVGNFDRLVERFDLPTVTDCDSEALTLLIERLKGTLVERFGGSIAHARAGGPVALLGLWPRPRRLLAGRGGNPLHLSDGPGGTYMASTPESLPGSPRSVADGDVIEFIYREGASHVRVHTGAADRSDGAAHHALAKAGAACGGRWAW